MALVLEQFDETEDGQFWDTQGANRVPDADCFDGDFGSRETGLYRPELNIAIQTYFVRIFDSPSPVAARSSGQKTSA
jgi:hypothetical protein